MKHTLTILAALVLLCSAKLAAAPIVNPLNGHSYMVTAVAVTYPEARYLADAVGGHLVTISGIRELDFVRSAFGRSEMFWLGMESDGLNYAWYTGEPTIFTYWGAADRFPVEGYNVVFNALNSRHFTRGFFGKQPATSLFRAIIEFDN